MTDKIAIIGDTDTVVGFRLAGILNSNIPSDASETRQALLTFSQDSNISIIIITEPLAEENRETIEELSERPYPVIVEIPDKTGRLEGKESSIRRLVKRAIGVELEGF
ncbi:MAG: V-type ATP synthase subunit F [Promethearchaeota archaeon]